jgi:hypothetical protein
MQNLSSPAASAQPLPTTTTPAEKLSEAQLLIASAFRRADDESNDFLSWGDRDAMCRQMNTALRLMREAREAITVESDPLASCLSCGAEERADLLAHDQCPTCEFLSAVSH